jgi:hypothetical protein
MVLYYTPRHEDILGTDLSGTDGNTNREYSLTYSGAASAGAMVSVDGTWLQYGFHYILTSDKITFLVSMFDSSIITLDYQTISTSGIATGAYYTTPSLVQAELRASTAFSSSTIPSEDTVWNWIDEESRVIDAMTGQIFSNQVVSSAYIDYDGEQVLRFPQAPLVSIDKVEYNSGGLSEPSWTELEEGFGKDFLSYLDLGEIEFINKTYTPGSKKFRLSYTYGYGSIPAEIQRIATLMVAKRTLLSLASNQANTEGGSIQIGTIHITDPTNYSINYLNTMDNTIKEGLKNLSYRFKVYRGTRLYQ